MSNKNLAIKKNGFTLIELLLVVAIIAMLATLVFVALNPIQRFRDTRNSRRVVDVNSILTAVHECIIDNDGATSSCIGSLTSGEKYEIVSDASSGCNAVCSNTDSDTHCAELDSHLSAYLKELPIDPGGATTGHTEYEITIDSNNIITITACSAESPETYGGTDTIKVSR